MIINNSLLPLLSRELVASPISCIYFSQLALIFEVNQHLRQDRVKHLQISVSRRGNDSSDKISEIGLLCVQLDSYKRRS